MRLLCALEAEGGPTLAGNIHWLPSHIGLHLHSILAPCVDSSYLLSLFKLMKMSTVIANIHKSTTLSTKPACLHSHSCSLCKHAILPILITGLCCHS